jgi:hypothetical protein
MEEAADTLRKLPPVIPRARLCSWPAIIRDFWELYCDSDPLPRRSAATSKAVTEMDEALEWLSWVPLREARVIWMRACHIRWRLIAERMNVSRRTASDSWKKGLEAIAARLNQEQAIKASALEAKALRG